MDFQFKSSDFQVSCAAKADLCIVLVPEGFAASGACADVLHAAIKAADLAAGAGKSLSLYNAAGFGARRVLCVGVGMGGVKEIRTAVGAGMSTAKSANAKTVVICGAALAHWSDAHTRAAVAASADASYVYETTKTKVEGRTVKVVTLAVGSSAALPAAKAAFDVAVATVSGVELAKEWANRPGNYCTPALLADACQAMCKAAKIGCEVLGPKEVQKLGMGSFMSVSQGSNEPLRFVVMRYNGGAKTDAPVVLVGKGITFDTGGISLKPGAEMDEMKFDMGGAASVLGAFKALGEIKPKINVVGIIAACENMPDGKAVKPGDVVTSMSGQTIEILNTDAEGRLILCDALTYAERFKPACVVDVATLTGACVIALGAVRSGMYASKDDLGDALAEAGDVAQDLCWRMPLDDEYAEGLKSNFADVANIAGRAGGSITAAKFLQRFATKFTWGHLDIAATAWKGGASKGATGRPVGLLVQFVLGQVGKTGGVASTVPKSVRASVAKAPSSAKKPLVAKAAVK